MIIEIIAKPLFTQHYPPGSQVFHDLVNRQVAAALDEDIGTGDLTASLLPADQQKQAAIVTREDAILCGTDWAQACFKQLDPAIRITWLAHEGQRVKAGQTLCEISGTARAILSAERCALNFLQTLSAVATQTRQYVDAIAGTSAKILDTRKTIPGMRLAEKYAVTVGGGHNQRLALYDGVLIKENHIAATGGIKPALEAASRLASRAGKTISVQIEVESLDELAQALAAGATSVLLDDFSPADMREAVRITQKRALLEASGGVDLTTVRNIAETGVDRISIGSLTKHIRAIDLSLRIT